MNACAGLQKSLLGAPSGLLKHAVEEAALGSQFGMLDGSKMEQRSVPLTPELGIADEVISQ